MVQQKKRKQEIIHSAYLTVKEGYSDEREAGRESGLVFWADGQRSGDDDCGSI